MKKILLIGAGRSSTSLIDYLLHHAASGNWELTVGDFSEQAVHEKTKGHPASRPIRFDIDDREQTLAEVGRADIVISLLPAHMHISVARMCVALGKHLVTASYVTPEMEALQEDAVSKGVILLNECGLDPGIDHMSAMEIIRAIRSEGGELTSFYSYTGGLVAPESNDNPWGYKFSWNPRNVILAGQGTARYIENGRFKYIPYNRLFRQIETIEVESVGRFDGYANRDSLSYRKTYGLDGLPTLLRGTLRQHGFCTAWDVFVRLGLTDDTYAVEDSAHMTYANLVESFLPDRPSGSSLRASVAALCDLDAEGPEMDMVEWTGIFSSLNIGLPSATPARILQQLLEEKWKLQPNDKDMIVMQHRFGYAIGTKRFLRTSSLVVVGDDNVHTAMAKTVGLPAAIAARNILDGTVSTPGVCIPVTAEICVPVLRELETLGIRFSEKTVEVA
jgi:saccharopine dehydrogenase-like NADP-dependent oxidoreductase